MLSMPVWCRVLWPLCSDAPLGTNEASVPPLTAPHKPQLQKEKESLYTSIGWNRSGILARLQFRSAESWRIVQVDATYQNRHPGYTESQVIYSSKSQVKTNNEGDNNPTRKEQNYGPCRGPDTTDRA
ncbi:hypothetical protein Y1Q_0005006 [Alligator mississippiensis]|uniref:Uncharacterized protein n=1 Tax=Alligator mississippiensis TaxID=8496 RepID=A0A151PK35_ALLMI|nr:hypothetical protein Y1Q_0005006 [Alligator mississippiensis]